MISTVSSPSSPRQALQPNTLALDCRILANLRSNSSSFQGFLGYNSDGSRTTTQESDKCIYTGGMVDTGGPDHAQMAGGRQQVADEAATIDRCYPASAWQRRRVWLARRSYPPRRQILNVHFRPLLIMKILSIQPNVSIYGRILAR